MNATFLYVCMFVHVCDGRGDKHPMLEIVWGWNGEFLECLVEMPQNRETGCVIMFARCSEEAQQIAGLQARVVVHSGGCKED